MISDDDGKFLVVVAFLIERNDQILLLRRSMAKDHAPGEWEVGSGRVRQRESALEAVVREAREETGLEVHVVRPLDTFHFYRGKSQVETIGVTFHCRATRGELTLSPEHIEAKWVRMSIGDTNGLVDRTAVLGTPRLPSVPPAPTPGTVAEPRSRRGVIRQGHELPPVIDLLRSYFRINHPDTYGEIRKKVTEKITTLDRVLEPDLPQAGAGIGRHAGRDAVPTV
jgi:8-oxo-dGTP diphosphatase